MAGRGESCGSGAAGWGFVPKGGQGFAESPLLSLKPATVRRNDHPAGFAKVGPARGRADEGHRGREHGANVPSGVTPLHRPCLQGGVSPLGHVFPFGHGYVNRGSSQLIPCACAPLAGQILLRFACLLLTLPRPSASGWREPLPLTGFKSFGWKAEGAGRCGRRVLGPPRGEEPKFGLCLPDPGSASGIVCIPRAGATPWARGCGGSCGSSVCRMATPQT